MSGVMRRLVSVVVIWIAGVWTATPATAATILIDGFQQGSFNLTSTGSTVGTNNSGVDVIGGVRAVSFVRHMGTPTATLSPGGPLSVGTSFHSLQLGYGTRYMSGALVGDTRNALGADLSSTDGFEFEITTVSGNLDIAISMDTIHDSGLGRLQNTNTPVRINAPGTYKILCSVLPVTVGLGVNLVQIDYILVSFTGTEYAIGSIKATGVPEPAIGGVMVAGLAMLTLSRRRREPSNRK